MTVNEKYKLWCENAVKLKNELLEMNDDEREDSFYTDLSFGTGGLRGIIGAGTNRMNFYTVAKASEGLADYIKNNFSKDCRRIAVSYDSRNFSYEFAKCASETFAANGIEVYIYPELMPTPCLSYAVRALSCAGGIMITASHNPKMYNGYKVYGNDGCQITDSNANEILSYINKIDIFKDVKTSHFEEEVKKGKIKYIPKNIKDEFINCVLQSSVLFGDDADKDISIVYSPLNGTGLVPVTETLKKGGFSHIYIVAEQREPNGDFPTCPYPNPEEREALKLGMIYAKEHDADVVLATDPDCDRVGIAVKNGEEYRLFSGNETGILLLDYICSQLTKHGKMPRDAVAVKTIVTAEIAEKIAKSYGVKTVNVLTGFKYIGEHIGLLEKNGREESFIFGFEESYGYLRGSYVRDKDAVAASYLISEMIAYYRKNGISIYEKLKELYNKYGYSLNTLHSYKFEGENGMKKMKSVMSYMRSGNVKIKNCNMIGVTDYLNGIDGLPCSNVVKFDFDIGSAVVRPSGTEPKLKIYISVSAENERDTEIRENKIEESFRHLIFESK